jgi:hypothetical protein
MTNQQLLALFNKDPKSLWRVDWYGYLHTVDEYGERYTDPHVELYLSKVIAPADQFDFNKKTATDYGNQLKINVPIEWLCALRIGDVLNQKSVFRTGEQNHRILDLQNVNINEDNILHIAAGGKSPDGEYYLPSGHHPYHLNATRVRCAVVDIDGTKKLVIPHYVILQTYFSKCSFVFKQLFQHGIYLGSLYDADKSFIDEELHAFIHLRQSVHDIAAPEVARIAFDIDAQVAAKKVSNSIAAQIINEEKHLFPTTQFPFTGLTNLKVYGKWCVSKTLSTFVVFGILECTSAFPFQSLDFFRDAPGDKNKDIPQSTPKPNGDKDEPKPRKKRPVLDNDFAPELTETPDNKLFNMDVDVKPRTIHHGLTSVTKVRVEPHKPKNGYKSPIDTENVGQGNAGDGKRDGQGVPMTFVTGGEIESENEKFVFSSKVDRLQLFDDVCSILRAKLRVENLEYRLSKSQLSDKYARFPHVKNSKGSKLNWPYSNYIKGVPLKTNEKPTLRKVAIVEFQLPGSLVYLFEAERRILERLEGWVELDQPALFLIQSQSKDRLTDFQLEYILKKSAENRGIWTFDMSQHTFECYSIKHPDNDTIDKGSYTKKFVEIIDAKLGLKDEQLAIQKIVVI